MTAVIDLVYDEITSSIVPRCVRPERSAQLRARVVPTSFCCRTIERSARKKISFRTWQDVQRLRPRQPKADTVGQGGQEGAGLLLPTDGRSCCADCRVWRAMTPASAAEGSIARRCGPGLRASRAAPPRLRACPQRHPSCGQAAGAPALPCPRSVACVLPTMHAHMLTRDAAPLLQRRCDGTGDNGRPAVRTTARPHDRPSDRPGGSASRPARDGPANERERCPSEQASRASLATERPGDPTGRPDRAGERA